MNYKSSVKRAITLIELIIVVIIVGVLAGFALPKYTRAREKAKDKQAQVILGLIRSAQRAYRMELHHYYPPPAAPSVGDIPTINSNLGLDLVDDGSWSYSIATDNGFNATMTRDAGGYNRSWQINSAMTNATCVPIGGSNCP